jgi:hypothetical protein
MRLPRADVAIVDKVKIIEYLLNPKHADGAPKANFFENLGFRVEAWQELASALKEVAQICPVEQIVESVHGRKYIIEGEITSPAGKTAYVRTVWIVDAGSDLPRLVTAYPCKQV